MKKLLMLAVLCSGFSATAEELKPLVRISSFSFLDMGNSTYTLMTDGRVYQTSADLVSKKSSKPKAVARVTSQEQLESIMDAISNIPADSHIRDLTSKEKAENELCENDGANSTQIFDSRFEGGALEIQTSVGCAQVGIAGRKAYLADAIVRMIESVYSVPAPGRHKKN
jgi:hypothetical protein